MSETEQSNILGELIRLCVRKLGILEKDELTCCGCSLAQGWTVREIGQAGSISLNELAASLNLDNSTVSRTVNGLVSQGWVERELDPMDRRFVTIMLTDSGRRLYQSIEDGLARYYRQLYAAIPAEKRSEVEASLRLLLEAATDCECC